MDRRITQTEAFKSFDRYVRGKSELDRRVAMLNRIDWTPRRAQPRQPERSGR